MNLDIFSISIKTVFAYSYRSLYRGGKHAFFPFGVLPHHIGVCTLTVSTGVEPASPERQSGVLAVILRDYTAETGAFAHSLRIQARLPPCLIENVGLEPLCCFPKAVCSHYTTFSLSPQPATIRRFRFGKPVCCQLHHTDT